ncbi:kinase-like domain-containing protein [Entophlyctis helioformis]|nr:kinase-like domain-containing protein [Entophlyctis helioformis]
MSEIAHSASPGGPGTGAGAGSAAMAVASGKSGSPEPDSIIGNFRLDRTIGQGTYGKVRLGLHIHTDEKVAVKIIEKIQIQSPKQVARLQREIRFLKLLHHPHIVKVYDVVETNDFIYIVMEYAVGGELFDYIVAHKRVKEKEARSFFRMVLSAVDYCHKNAVIHRDLKPENLLLDEKKSIKIIDFGFGNNFTLNGLLDTFCGSPFYAAPEMILGKKYEGPEVDMWSLGVILFALLCGHLPFDDDNMKELYKKIASGSYKCPDYLLPNARHLISRLITVDPKRRATLDEVLAHPWVNDGYEAAPPNYIPHRPVINDPLKLSKDIVNRLQIFGYKLDDIHKAFSPDQDFSSPHPIRATYFLLSEMVAREQARLRNERRRVSGTSPNPASIASAAALAKQKSSSLANLGQSLPMIDEDGHARPPANSNGGPSRDGQSPSQSNPASLNHAEFSSGPGKDRSNITQYRNKDYGSIPVLSTRDAPRRASTPDGYARVPNPDRVASTPAKPSISAAATNPASNTSSVPGRVPAKQDERAATSVAGGNTVSGSQVPDASPADAAAATAVPAAAAAAAAVASSDHAPTAPYTPLAVATPPSSTSAHAQSAAPSQAPMQGFAVTHKNNLPPLPDKYESIGMGHPINSLGGPSNNARADTGSAGPVSHGAQTGRVQHEHFASQSRAGPSAAPLSAKDLFRRQSVPANMLSDAGAQYQSQPILYHQASHSQQQSQQQLQVSVESPKTPSTARRISTTAGKIKEDLRAVSGWFLNVSTTSSRPPDDLLVQIVRILNDNHAAWRTGKQVCPALRGGRERYSDVQVRRGSRRRV